MKTFRKVLAIMLIGFCICSTGCVNKQVQKAMVRDLKKADAQQAGLCTLNIDNKYVLKNITEKDDGSVESIYYDETAGSEGIICIGVITEEGSEYTYGFIDLLKLMKKFNYKYGEIDELASNIMLEMISNTPELRNILIDIGNNMECGLEEIRGNNAILIKGYSNKYNVSLIVSIAGDTDSGYIIMALKRDNMDSAYTDARKVIGSVVYNGKIPDIEFEDYDESEISIEGLLYNSMLDVDGEISNETYQFDSNLDSIDSIESGIK